MPKYFLCTGPGRTATRWLANFLDSDPEAAVFHDEFLPINFTSSMRRWQTGGTPTIGAVSGAARYHIPQLWTAFKPVVIFLWRDPIGLIKSHVEIQLRTSNGERTDGGAGHRQVPGYETLDMLIRRTAHILLGDLEAAMGLCKHYEIPVHHADMKDFLTEPGAYALAEILGVKPTAYEKSVLNKTPSNDRIVHQEWWEERTKSRIMALVNSLTNVREGYDRAKQWASTLKEKPSDEGTEPGKSGDAGGGESANGGAA